ncbi:DUF1223 domain-containing protein [Parvularcula maris]|uniref:DUF1223 domain-containing protein n=1 Tax=Parvularcula maris TaxID=2965077 RepID=A0A9X2L8N9_9PROT|nr:DUF1223 domain-containing protein [Parvularcula maris]MCQ8184959.1 DUF1223 domain-containing protein [Parvularcula maris]
MRLSLVAVLAGLSASASAFERSPVLAELFTSQSCSSCPPAEALFSELAERDDLVVLEWHVDYWNRLVHGGDGRWQDPFSDPAFTERQRRYNQNIRKTRRVYTPQAVVAGELEAVGSRPRDVGALIRRAPRPEGSLTVEATGEGFSVRAESEEPAELWLVRFDRRQSTDVLGGENKGRTLASRHVVRSFELLSEASSERTATAEKPGRGEGCAVLLQKPGQGEVLGARYCQSR